MKDNEKESHQKNSRKKNKKAWRLPSIQELEDSQPKPKPPPEEPPPKDDSDESQNSEDG